MSRGIARTRTPAASPRSGTPPGHLVLNRLAEGLTRSVGIREPCPARRRWRRNRTHSPPWTTQRQYASPTARRGVPDQRAYTAPCLVSSTVACKPGQERNAFISTTDSLLHKGAVIRVTEPRRVGEGRDAYIDYLVLVEVRGRQLQSGGGQEATANRPGRGRLARTKTEHGCAAAVLRIRPVPERPRVAAPHLHHPAAAGEAGHCGP